MTSSRGTAKTACGTSSVCEQLGKLPTRSKDGKKIYRRKKGVTGEASVAVSVRVETSPQLARHACSRSSCALEPSFDIAMAAQAWHRPSHGGEADELYFHGPVLPRQLRIRGRARPSVIQKGVMSWPVIRRLFATSRRLAVIRRPRRPVAANHRSASTATSGESQRRAM